MRGETAPSGVASTELAGDAAAVAVLPGATEFPITGATATPETEAPARSRRPLKKLLVRLAMTVVGLLALVAVGVYWRTQRASALTDKDTIVLADFDNSTGEPIFDDALTQALAIKLEESPFLNILSGRRVAATMRMMGQPPDERLTEKVALEVCLRTNSKALLEGSIAPVGDHYLVGVKALNCQTGDTLASVDDEAENRNTVLRTLSHAGNEMRKKLGESLASVARFDTPIEQATTPSIDALKSYSLGLKTQVSKGEGEAIPFYERAVDLDPNFAMAYARMGVIYANLLQPKLAAMNLAKAFQLRDGAMEREKLYIAAHYYMDVVGDLPKAIEAFTVYKQTYPRDASPYINLGAIYDYVGEYERSLAVLEEGLQLDPGNANTYANCLGNYLSLGRIDDAKTILQKAKARKIANEFLSLNAYLLAFLTGDAGEMRRQLLAEMGNASLENYLLSFQSATEAFYGHLGKAREYTRRAVASAERSSQHEPADLWQLSGALQEIEVGISNPVIPGPSQSLSGPRGKGTAVLAGLALARSGNAKRAQKIADQLATDYPHDTVVQFYWLPAIRAAILLDAKNAQEAVKQLQPALPYELGGPVPQVALMYPVYLRGLAYLQLGQSQLGCRVPEDAEPPRSHRELRAWRIGASTTRQGASYECQ